MTNAIKHYEEVQHGVRANGIGRKPRPGLALHEMDARVYIRAATSSDGEKLRRMLSRSSTETINRRFHIPYQELPQRVLALMLDVDRHDRQLLVAVADGEIVGHAMFVTLEDTNEAEMAIVIEDEWQSKGLGRLLLSELAHRARLVGIEAFVAEVLGENRLMLGLAAMFAGTGYTMAGGVYRVRMPLGMPDSGVPAALTVLRVANGSKNGKQRKEEAA